MANLFTNSENEWEEEWIGMPEFNQQKKEPYAKITFRFESEEDLADFSEIIGQKLTKKTKSRWHPFKEHRQENPKIWIDES